MERPYILVVDDDHAIAEVVGHLLRAEGYQATQADGPWRAVRIVNDSPKLDVLLTDVDMPDMTGLELARLAQKLHPNLRLILMTGTQKPNWLPMFREKHADVPVLEKPFNTDALVKAVQLVLDHAPAPVPQD